MRSLTRNKDWLCRTVGNIPQQRLRDLRLLLPSKSAWQNIKECFRRAIIVGSICSVSVDRTSKVVRKPKRCLIFSRPHINQLIWDSQYIYCKRRWINLTVIKHTLKGNVEMEWCLKKHGNFSGWIIFLCHINIVWFSVSWFTVIINMEQLHIRHIM